MTSIASIIAKPVSAMSLEELEVILYAGKEDYAAAVELIGHHELSSRYVELKFEKAFEEDFAQQDSSQDEDSFSGYGDDGFWGEADFWDDVH